MCVHAKSLRPRLTLCDPMDVSPPGSSCPWDSPGNNIGASCHALLQAIFPIQGWNLCLLHSAGRGSGQQEAARGQCAAGGGDPQAGTDNVPIWEADGAAPPHSSWGLCGGQHRQLNVGARAGALRAAAAGKEQKEESSQFSKCPAEDSMGGVNRQHTHSPHVFTRIVKSLSGFSKYFSISP